MSLCIFDIHLSSTIYVRVPYFYDLSALVGCWSSVSIRRIIYKFLNVCPFDYTAVAVCGKVERFVNRFTHTIWVTAVTPTDRPNSVRNRCVIEVFGGVFMLSHCFLDFSVSVGVFVIGLSQISSFSLEKHVFNAWYEKRVYYYPLKSLMLTKDL